MNRIRLLFFVICLAIAFSSVSHAVEKQAGLFEEAAPVQAPDLIKPDAVMKVEQTYDEAIAAKAAEIEAAGSPAEAERLQREVEDLKEEKIIAVREALFKIAVEEGKAEEAESLRNDLMLLTRVRPVHSLVKEKQPLPGPEHTVRQAVEKNPDDR